MSDAAKVASRGTYVSTSSKPMYRNLVNNRLLCNIYTSRSVPYNSAT